VRGSHIIALALSFAAGCTMLAGLDGDYQLSAAAVTVAAPTGTGAGGDAPSTGGAAGEAGGGGAAGEGGAPLGPFGTPKPLTTLNSDGEEDDPALTDDMLEIFFESDRNGSGDLWTSRRMSTTEAWPAPSYIYELNLSQSTEGGAEISSDGLVLIFNSSVMGTADLYFSTRGSRGEAWSPPQLLDGLASAWSDYSAADTPGLTLLFFASTRPGIGGADVWSSQRQATTGPWDAPMIVGGEISTIADEADPWLDPTGNILFFASNRRGTYDIYSSERPDSDSPFEIPTPIMELNGGSTDGDPWLTPDMKTVVFSSNRDGDSDLYIAER
jgi:hypothetical protein